MEGGFDNNNGNYILLQIFQDCENQSFNLRIVTVNIGFNKTEGFNLKVLRVLKV